MSDWPTLLKAARGTPNWWRTYSAYLKSPEWRALRKPVLERAGGHCEECGEETYLQVHHLNYKRVGAERLEDLRAICNPCHEGHHPHMPRTFAERWAAAGGDPTWERG
jgi:5-methylcytosine-specific restriction endonuclease McrA